MIDFEKVRTSNNLIDLAERLGARMHRNGAEWRGTCPIHKGDNPTGFAVYDAAGKQMWKCFSGDCGGGDVVDFVMAVYGLSTIEAVRMLGGGQEPDPAHVAQINAERAERAAAQLEEQISRAQAALAEIRSTEAWVRYNQNRQNNQRARQLWRARGIDDSWQDYFQLGYSQSFAYYANGVPAQSETLTIPIFAQGWEVQNIRHRILQPINPADKYRPERAGLPSTPYMCDPDAGLDADQVLIVEGEIKAMVTYITMDQPEIQVIGVPGKSQAAKLVDELRGKNVTICLDPDALEEAESFAHLVGGSVINLKMKIDDVITAGGLDKYGIRSLIKSARKV